MLFANKIIVLLLQTYSLSAQNYRQFPPLSNLARERSTQSAPTESSCGTPVRSSFCRSSTSSLSVTNCVLDYCDQVCPLRYELPQHTDLMVGFNYGTCVAKDTINRVLTTEFSAVFQDSPSCYLVPDHNPEVRDNGDITILFWINIQSDTLGTVIEQKSLNGVLSLRVQVSTEMIRFGYLTSSGTEIIDFLTRQPKNIWVHLAIQVYDRFVNLFINGTDFGSNPAVSTLLTSRINLHEQTTSRIGQNVNGTSQFIGRIQDLRSYKTTLSNREIDEVMTGSLPELQTQPECRCPGSHPRVKPYLPRYCIKNGVGDTTSDQLLRLDQYAHPLEYINDGDTNSIWISQQIGRVSLTIDMGDNYQVFYVVLQFYSPLPKGVRIERQLVNSEVWTDWQFYADDCQTYYSLPNNGELSEPNAVNCLQLTTDGDSVPYSRGNITFNILSQSPVARPGHNDFYNTPELYQFVQASRVRVTLLDHYYVQNPKHQYYGIYEFLITGRCDCNGHAASCNTLSLPYTCNCDVDSFTVDKKCSRCGPLYNDKPFRVGDQVNSYSCKPCTCHDHADECIYNSTLDAFPNDHNRGGGGQCINCRDDTEGPNCDQCRATYYRDLSKELSDPNICQSCDCDARGTVGGSTHCNPLGGQCECKENVQGRRCDKCKSNTHSLLQTNILGCSDCNCNPAGVLNGSMSCDELGRCQCKANVREDKCTVCEFGFYNLTTENVDGCSVCQCDPRASRSQFCDTNTGQCLCKSNVIGDRCDECVDGRWNLSANCIPCSAHCDPVGTEPNTICDKNSGRCLCKRYVEGYSCDLCETGYYSFGSSTVNGCTICGCNTAGTVNTSIECDRASGQCNCKPNVAGITCNGCRANTYGLSANNSDGCSQCSCDQTGTLNGDKLSRNELPCDQNTGQCTCLSNRLGRRCDNCADSYYRSTQSGGGCLQCGCHARGSVSTVCDSVTGQCSCKLGNAGVGGRTCNQCLPEYYNFNNTLGRCAACECVSAGTINMTCNSNTGQCNCKVFVQGQRCDECVAESSDLNEDNPFGCSTLPSQQPPPTHIALSSTSLQLIWAAPDYPNGIILLYKLYRNNQLIESIDPETTSYDPQIDPWFRYNDTGLSPYSNYTYRVESVNDFGSASSPSVVFRTPPGAPLGILQLQVSQITAYTAVFNWSQISDATGRIERYVISAATDINPDNIQILYEGTSLNTAYSQLQPFTNYSFTVSACTSGGCLLSSPVWILTAQAAPRGQANPNITAVNSTSLYIEWKPPAEPNGVIIYYELWISGLLRSDGTRDPPASLIFHPSGQYNPRPADRLENALQPPATNYTVSGLLPYTQYQFQVLSQNDISKASSDWVTARTLEAAPTAMPAPIVTAVNSTSLHIEWLEPSSSQINGRVIIYRLYKILKSNQAENPFDPPTYTQEIFSSAVVQEFILTTLQPYTVHTFSVQVCNSISCVTSDAVAAETLPAAPSKPGFPLVEGVNSTSLRVGWMDPAQFNGPPPFYTVLRSEVAFSSPPPRVISGTRFSGGGYYLFPPSTVPQGVTFTGIDFWFKTRESDGLLLYLTSADQEEVIAIQLYRGRPWFLFDPQGCTTTISVTDDEGLPYNDGEWHYLYVHREGREGTIILDNIYSGVRTAECATGQIIGTNTGVYIGGLPKDFIITKSESDPRALVTRQNFQGCIGEVRILQQQFPVERWTILDWESAIGRRDCYPAWHGCPVSVEVPATHFPGRGWLEIDGAALTERLSGSVQIDFSFRTSYPNGVLFYIYGGKNVYMYCILKNGALIFSFKQDSISTTVTLDQPQLLLCDALWKTVTLAKVAQQLTIVVNNQYQAQAGGSQAGIVNIASNLYVGGIPPQSEANIVAEQSNLTLPRSFGGCIKSFRINRRDQNFIALMVNFTAVNLDGCPAESASQSPCQPSQEVTILNSPGVNTTIDSGLQPFTDYMYNVEAANPGGMSQSDWSIGTTREGLPSGVIAPYSATALSGYSFEVSWHHPTGNTGLIQSYIITAYDQQRDGVKVLAIFNDSTILYGVVNDTIPFTNYSLTLTACTVLGCTESISSTHIQTFEEVPEQMQPPFVLANGVTYITVSWNPPLYPNGILTGYLLHYENQTIPLSMQTQYTITGLLVFTPYKFRIAACNVIGCSYSSEVHLRTAELPPEFVEPPLLTVYGTRRIDTRWLAPERLNGVLERYLIYISTLVNIRGDLVYNSTDVGFLSYRNENLQSGTTYYFTLAACTGGGCTSSVQSSARTEESSPDLVQDPVITPISATFLHVTWSPPLLPNGVITNYSLSQNGVANVHVSNTVLQYNATQLLPYSTHTFQLKVCTVKGCTLSNQVTGQTLEAQPQGQIILTVKRPIAGPRRLQAHWTGVNTPNGVVMYQVMATGMFYRNSDSGDYSRIQETRVLYNTIESGSFFAVTGFNPYTEYLLQVNVSNSAGYVVSNQVTVTMPPGSPDGVSSLVIDVLNSSTVRVEWSPPAHVNGPSPPGVVYQLYFRAIGSTDVNTIYDQPTSARSYLQTRLQPYSEYEFRLQVINEVDSTHSNWTRFTTAQSAPVYINAVTLLEKIRSVAVMWIVPSKPNGVITSYVLYMNGSEFVEVNGTLTAYRVTELLPYTVYWFTIKACTIAGCSNQSAPTYTTTLQGVPEGLKQPSLISLTSTSILISWSRPSRANGVITQYTVERWVSEQSLILIHTTDNLGSSLSFVYEGEDVLPYTTYTFRVTVHTEGGEISSNWTSLITKQGRPVGVDSPRLSTPSSTVINVRWSFPSQPNGVINRFIIKLMSVPLNDSYLIFSNKTVYNITDLLPYTEYFISVSACTAEGGCTESAASLITTPTSRPSGVVPPIPIVQSQTFISVQWSAPLYSNAPSIRYRLTRIKVRQPLEDDVEDLLEWIALPVGDASLFYNDRGLSIYTSYIYRITVWNSAGFTHSDNSTTVTTQGGQPLIPATLTSLPINHTAIFINWTLPDEHGLQGQLNRQIIVVKSNSYSRNINLTSTVTSYTLSSLSPHTQYNVKITLYNIGDNQITSTTVLVTTLDGAPEGVLAPRVFIVSESTLRISWSEPLRANGRITGYRLYSGDVILHNSTESEPKSYLYQKLQPYTVYTIRLEVCTEYGCVKSSPVQATTAESPPLGLPDPEFNVLSAISVQIDWSRPVQPNGIIQYYTVYRREEVLCSTIVPVTNGTYNVCEYRSCQPLEGFCGTQCYSGVKACCDDVLYDPMPNHTCCGKHYIIRRSSNQACCGGKFVTVRENYQCCHNQYVEVLEGEICCSDGNRVNVGHGDSCCGSIPYYTESSQICCNHLLHGRFNQQCCGGHVVSDSLQCCGNREVGTAYPRVNDVSMTCCGEVYHPTERSVCCVRSPYTKSHVYRSAQSMLESDEKCCGLERISRSLSCCNNKPYDSSLYTCSDVGQGGSSCGTGLICPKGSSAFCNSCNFDNTNTCHAIAKDVVIFPGFSSEDADNFEMCLSTPSIVYRGPALQYTDLELSPYTRYDYALSVTNQGGTYSTSYLSIRTAQSAPFNITAPRYVISAVNVISLSWTIPSAPNGEILNYTLLRGGEHEPVIIYTGLELEYRDNNGIQPYKTYTYILRACTIAGCSQSLPIEAATLQAPPSDVSRPVVGFVNSSSVFLQWRAPGSPNGIIVSYIIYDGTEQMWILNSQQHQYLISGLSPYTEYSFHLGVCTEVSCTNSSVTMVTTQQALPSGISIPRTIVLSNTSLIVVWSEPDNSNGVLDEYELYRRVGSEGAWLLVYSGSNLSYRDSGLAAGSVYQFYIKVSNAAGTVSSGIHAVMLPRYTASSVPAPTVLRSESAYSIYIQWTLISDTNSQTIDQYQVVVNGGDEAELTYSLSSTTDRYLITGLYPYTVYSIRIRACLKNITNSCATGAAAVIRTQAAAPEQLSPPDLVSVSSNVVIIRWSAPQLPNGVISSYSLYRRLTEDPSNSFIIGSVDNETFTFTDTGPDILAYTQYDYQIKCENNIGSAFSMWLTVRTQEAPPTSLSPPVVVSLGAFSMRLQWSEPERSNGVISMYVIEYRSVIDPTFTSEIERVKVAGDIYQTYISGLIPTTQYQVRLQCENGAGSTTSNWTSTLTGESSPDLVQPITAQPSSDGRSLSFTWFPPSRPNGKITSYSISDDLLLEPIYTGLINSYIYARLEPYMKYTVRLSACTSSGCTPGDWQTFSTAEILPNNQQPPTAGQITDTTVTLRWSSPVNSNGQIIKYEVLRRVITRLNKRQTPDQNMIIYNTSNTDQTEYNYTDINLLPYTRYSYVIRSSNSVGSVSSDPLIIETREGRPSTVHPPTVTYYEGVYDKLRVSWRVPDELNGVLLNYQLKRNNSVPLTFQPDHNRIYNDSGLRAYTVYSYTITACTSGGCVTSNKTMIRTLQTPPQYINQPTTLQITPISIGVNWSNPEIINGVLSRYVLGVDNTDVYTGLEQQYNITNLQPFTQYRITITACTAGGCVSSSAVVVRTLPDTPRDLSAPTLRVLSATSIEIRWNAPSRPNGVIRRYELSRRDELIFSELGFSYTDINLTPNTQYSYSITAVNDVSFVRSDTASITTYTSSPAGLAPPIFSFVTSSTMLVSWASPNQPNGLIKNYTLYDDSSSEILYTGLELQTTVYGLQAFTSYSMRIQACTDGGCLLSSSSQQQTLESSPRGLDSPVLTPQASSTGAHIGVLIRWSSPRFSNGVIVRYEVERRRVGIGGVYTAPEIIYNTTLTEYLDTSSQLKPATRHEYRLRAYNSVGFTTSEWSWTVTYQSVPTGLHPPTLQSSSATTVTVEYQPPDNSNGEITGYYLVINSTTTRVVDGLRFVHTLMDLRPYTMYYISVRVCTLVGCSLSEPLIVSTSGSVPENMSPPLITNITANHVTLTWSSPTQTNGELLGYIIYERLGCPLSMQPFNQSPCTPSDQYIKIRLEQPYIQSHTVSNLSSYTAYQWRIESYNQYGVSVSITWSLTTVTLSTEPALSNTPLQYRLANELLIIDWSRSFILNAPLSHSEIYIKSSISETREYTRSTIAANSTRIVSIPISQNDEMRFYVKIVTIRGTATTPTFTAQYGTGGVIDTTQRSMVTQEQTVPLEAWLIPIVLICLLLLALFIFLVARYCACGRSAPYVREKMPLQSRHRLQTDSFNNLHDYSRSSMNIAGTDPLHTSTSNVNADNMTDSYISSPQLQQYTNEAFDDNNRGAVIWPLHPKHNVPTTANNFSDTESQPDSYKPDSDTVSQSTFEFTPDTMNQLSAAEEFVLEPSKRKMISSDEEDVWDSVLHDSAMFDSDFTDSEQGYPNEPSTFTDTHL